MRRKAPPFFPNTPDAVHCFQASVRMVLAEKAPMLQVGLPELLFITGQSGGKPGTWPLRAAVYLAHVGFDVAYMDPFSLEQFIAAPEKALRSFYGDEIAEWQIENSYVERATVDARALLDSRYVESSFQIPSIDQLVRLLQSGYLCICNVNAKTLTAEPGYSGHFVVVYDIDTSKKTVHLQNPGPPASEETEVPFELFERAWACSGEMHKNILAFKESDRLERGLRWLERELESYREFVHRAAPWVPTSATADEERTTMCPAIGPAAARLS